MARSWFWTRRPGPIRTNLYTALVKSDIYGVFIFCTCRLSMFLILAVVYLFNGFQPLHATPLTSIFTDTSAASSPSGCVCPADQRSIWDILWSCLATIFACSWVSVHPNIPGPNEARWRILLGRLELMFWAILGPELLILWAFRQWLGARSLEKLYKDRKWTKTHGYFMQMGGFMLYEGEDAKGVLSPTRFSELLTAGKIAFPTLSSEEIEDRSKSDGFSKSIAVGQTLWFVVQCLARRADHLDITLIELLTLSLAALNGVMYFLWWHKPLDVRCPVRVYLQEPNEEEHLQSEKSESHVYFVLNFIFSRRHELAISIAPSLSILRNVLRITCRTIMILAFFLILLPILVGLVFIDLCFFLLRRFNSLFQGETHDLNTGDMKVPTFYSSEPNHEATGLMALLMSTTGAAFGGIHCAGWFFTFPSPQEAILWRVCSVILTGTASSLLIFMVIALQISEVLVFVTLALGFIAYVVSRLILLVEAFISLRHLTPGMLALVKWTSFIPHLN